MDRLLVLYLRRTGNPRAPSWTVSKGLSGQGGDQEERRGAGLIRLEQHMTPKSRAKTIFRAAANPWLAHEGPRVGESPRFHHRHREKRQSNKDSPGEEIGWTSGRKQQSSEMGLISNTHTA